MKNELQIVCHNLPQSEAVNHTIRQKLQKLETICDDITSCRVVLDAPHKHKNKGGLFRATIEVSLPEAELLINKADHLDLYTAIRSAFSTTHRQLLSNLNKRRTLQRQAS